jgi:hypothetical protein
MGQRTPFASDRLQQHVASQSTTITYRLQVWLHDEGWTEVGATWAPQVGWHYRAHVPPTDFTWLTCAEQVAQAIGENCGVTISITVKTKHP